MEKQAKPAIPNLKKTLDDQDEIPALAAWAIFKAGSENFATKWMLNEILANPEDKMLANVLDWMDQGSFAILAKIPENKLQKRGLLKDIVNRYKVRTLNKP